jgi:hypothetical protein
MSKTYDCTTTKLITTPERMIQFFAEIDAVCRKYGLTIAHEDVHGSFIIENFKIHNLEWLEMACKNYDEERLKHKPLKGVSEA